MTPFCSCIITKIAVLITLLFCTWILKDGIVLVVDITTMEPILLSDNSTVGRVALRQMMTREREVALQRLNNMDKIMEQNSDPLPERNNSLTARELCNRTRKCVPKLLNLQTRVRTAPKHKMLNCLVQKSMSTVMTAVMCFLYDEDAFLTKGRDFQMEWSKYRNNTVKPLLDILQTNGYRDDRFCKDKNEYNTVFKVREEHNIREKKGGWANDGWSFTMVTRDPIERFVSGFVDRCIRKPLGNTACNGCGVNMTCFTEREYDRIMEQIKEKHLKRTFEDVHFFPQNWRCELRHEYDNFEFLRYSSEDPSGFIDQVLKIAARQNVSKPALDFLRGQITNGKTVHVTSDSPTRKYLEDRLRNSPYLMEYVVRMFYHDFLLFNYPFPKGF